MIKLFFLFLLILFFTLPLFAQVTKEADTAWVRRYDGIGNGDDQAYAMVVDSCGNVYVTGWGWNGTNYDYVTIKYYPDGDTAWIRWYNGPGNGDDYAYAIAVDDCKNVYVTGTSGTIKYDATNGNQLWVGGYGGAGIAVDSSGNIYVTGKGNHDFITAKYYENGGVAWVETYDGPGHRDDGATAIAVDNSGNVYVTGYSDQDSGSSDAKDDYATIKYDSLGQELWVERYDYSEDDVAYDIAVDDSGYVYVTGWSDDILDSYKRLPGEQTGDENAETGLLHYQGLQPAGPPLWFHFATIKYNPDGDTVWVRRYSKPGANVQTGGEAIAVDGLGNVYVVGSSDWDYATIKYRPNGDTAWVRNYSYPGDGEDWAEALAVDQYGNVYVTGYSGTSPSYDYATVKYDSSGKQLWVSRYDGPGNSYDIAFAIALDDSGNVYVTGYSKQDFTTIKYSTLIFLRGDANSDTKVTVSDVVYLVNYLFKGGPPPNPRASGDANCDGKVTVSDVVYLINYLFKGGPPPC